jgi:aminoglycoside phosphotransferase (APT) family kinase protein
MMPSTRPQSVTRKNLEPILEIIAEGCSGRSDTLKAWHRRISAYSSSSIITWIRLEIAGTPRGLQLAFKNLTPGCQLPTARRVRPEFLYDPHREIATYQSILSHLNMGTPQYLGSSVEPGTPRYWLFVEWVKGPLLWQMGRLQHWQQAARWLAQLHHATSRLPDLKRLARNARLLEYNPSAYEHWIGRAESVLAKTLLRHETDTARSFARIARRYGRVINHLCQLPRTLVHGEFFPANIVMRWTGQTHQVCPVDWELAALGPGVLDLAALSAGEWNDAEKRLILAAYHAVICEQGPSDMTLDDLKRSTLYSQLHLCIRHLGWAARWRPQGQQARAWLAQSLTLAKQLGI